MLGGGGISCCGYSSPKITNNIITGNTGLYGGGIYCLDYSSPTILGNAITDNSADIGGDIPVVLVVLA